jgi:cytoskeletal protein CcmA (bactofilin family)
MMIIEADMVIQGHFTVIGAVRLDGRLEGTIVCSRLEIGPDGLLFGDAVVEELVVAGQIIGKVRARRLHLRETALVEGEIIHEQLQMDEAATLVGESRRHKDLPMPPVFVELQARARRAEDDYRALETATRVRLADEAARAGPQFEMLRSKFPARRAAG